jgi:hypothetical protein
MTKDEALMMAIKAEETGNLQDLVDAVNAAVNACKEALQQEALATNKESSLVQPAQKPVAIVYSMQDGYVGQMVIKDIPHKTKLYTHPHQWKGLTKHEIIQADNATNDLHAFAYAINAKLKEKNT